MYVFSQWVVPKVFPRSLAFTTSLPSHLLPPLYLLPPLQNYLLQSWLFGFGLNPTSISLHWSHGLWLVYPPPPPGAFAHLQCGQGQCSMLARCEHGGESWQEPEWITDDRWPTGGRRGIPAFLKRNTYPVANAGVGF